MNIYDAIMKAADHIEKNPRQFAFIMPAVPTEPTETACPLGWIGFFGQRRVTPENRYEIGRNFVAAMVAEHLLSTTENEFFNRMFSLQPWCQKLGSWKESASLSAECLRRYAAKYHAPAKATVLRTDAQLVADLMRKITTERIPEDA